MTNKLSNKIIEQILDCSMEEPRYGIPLFTETGDLVTLSSRFSEKKGEFESFASLLVADNYLTAAIFSDCFNLARSHFQRVGKERNRHVALHKDYLGLSLMDSQELSRIGNYIPWSHLKDYFESFRSDDPSLVQSITYLTQENVKEGVFAATRYMVNAGFTDLSEDNSMLNAKSVEYALSYTDEVYYPV